MKIVSVLLCCLLRGALAAQTVGPAPSALSAPSRIDSSVELALLMNSTEPSILLQPYDFLSVHVYGADAIAVKARIAPNGSIEIPLAGPISLSNMTVEQAQRSIAELLAQRHLVLSAAVTIEVLESPGRVLTVDGEVKNPGVYPALGDSDSKTSGTSVPGVHTLGQLLAAAGGLKDTASGVVTLIRPALAGPVSIPLGTDPNRQSYLNLPVFSGDVIRVSHVGQAYVVGAVKKQGAIQLKNYSPTLVSQAVAMSDGVGYEASADSALLLRTEGTKRVLVPVHVRKILQGKAEDIALQNDDILYIPTNEGKAALKSGAAGLIVSLASTYIYAHP